MDFESFTWKTEICPIKIRPNGNVFIGEKWKNISNKKVSLVDVFALFDVQPNLTRKDGVHPTYTGTAIFKATWSESIKKGHGFWVIHLKNWNMSH